MAQKKISSVLFFRVSLVCAVFSLMLLLLLSLTAWQMSKKLHVVAQFFPTTKNSATLGEFSQLNTLSPLDISGEKDREQIEEMLARYYLEMRYTQIPDGYEMAHRWGIGGPVFLLSTPSLYNKFAKNLESRLDSLPEIVRTIDIEDVKHKGGLFEIRFYVYENLSTGQVRGQYKMALLKYDYVPVRRIRSPYFSNPYGLVFTNIEENVIQN